MRAAKSLTPETRQAARLRFGEPQPHLTGTRARNGHACILETSQHQRVCPPLAASQHRRALSQCDARPPTCPQALLSSTSWQEGTWCGSVWHLCSLRSGRNHWLFGPVASNVPSSFKHLKEGTVKGNEIYATVKHP